MKKPSILAFFLILISSSLFSQVPDFNLESLDFDDTWIEVERKSLQKQFYKVEGIDSTIVRLGELGSSIEFLEIYRGDTLLYHSSTKLSSVSSPHRYLNILDGEGMGWSTTGQAKLSLYVHLFRDTLTLLTYHTNGMLRSLYVIKEFGHNDSKNKLEFDHFQPVILSSFLH